jgi:hypothetical protein
MQSQSRVWMTCPVGRVEERDGGDVGGVSGKQRGASSTALSVADRERRALPLECFWHWSPFTSGSVLFVCSCASSSASKGIMLFSLLHCKGGESSKKGIDRGCRLNDLCDLWTAMTVEKCNELGCWLGQWRSRGLHTWMVATFLSAFREF